MSESAPEVVILDANRPGQVRFSWDDCNFRVTLEAPQIRVSGLVYAEFGRELVDFFGLLSRRFPQRSQNPDGGRGMRGGWRVASNDDELCVEAWCAKKGFMELSISLASEMWNPSWVVRLNLSVAEETLPGLTESLAGFFRFGGANT
jgi:hypothetical protein